MIEAGYLVDLNVLLALSETDHEHRIAALHWFNGGGGNNWGTCPFTEAGFIRVMTNRRARNYTTKRATEVLALLTAHPGHRFWSITKGWTALTEPFSNRIFGHQQVTDALLLGLAVEENGILVTLDRGIAHLAGPQFSKNLLVLGLS